MSNPGNKSFSSLCLYFPTCINTYLHMFLNLSFHRVFTGMMCNRRNQVLFIFMSLLVFVFTPAPPMFLNSSFHCVFTGMMCNRCNQVLYSAVESWIRAGGLKHKSTKGESGFVPNWAGFTRIVSPFIFVSLFVSAFLSVSLFVFLNVFVSVFSSLFVFSM